ncbi:hypothetical protein [Microcoleus sp.]|uniref:hypothetical protein n=1 Tax=Microcoleus sp. TaxID=44472 RepID=UPI003525B30E
MTRFSTINLLHSLEKRSPLLEPKSEIPRSRKAIDLSIPLIAIAPVHRQDRSPLPYSQK